MQRRRTRGFVEVNNRLGGNCFACHVEARPEWDLVCDDSHGCDPTSRPSNEGAFFARNKAASPTVTSRRETS